MPMRPGMGALVDGELQRLRAVADLGQVGTPPEERFDMITRLARAAFGVPIARINLVDADTIFTKSPQSPDASPYLPRDGVFCDVAIQTPDMLVVNDATKDPRFSSRPEVTGSDQMRFYAGRPLTAGSDQRVGTLCLIGMKPRVFDDEERALLEQMAQLVEQELVK